MNKHHKSLELQINTIHNRAGDYHFQRLFIKQKLLNTIYLFMNHIDGICFIRNHAQAHVRVELTIPSVFLQCAVKEAILLQILSSESCVNF